MDQVDEELVEALYMDQLQQALSQVVHCRCLKSEAEVKGEHVNIYHC